MLELPKPPWYRRVWMLNLAVAVVVVVVLVAATVLLGSRGEPAAGPTTVTSSAATTLEGDATQPSAPATTAPRTTAKAVGALWEKTGSDVHNGSVFEAPGSWHLLWSFDCHSFRPYGGGNFKVTGEGDFAGVSVQEFAVKRTGSRPVRHGGRGRLVIESVCDRWTVKAVAP